MAREVTDVTRTLIESGDGGYDVTWVADLMYDESRRLANVPITNPSFAWDGGALIVGSGSCRVIWNDDHGETMIPRQIGDWFSPFGAELQVDVLITAGSHEERIPMGRFPLDGVPSSVESSFEWQGRTIHVGEAFDLTLKDRMLRVSRDPFPVPTAPRSNSAWKEATTITGFPVIRNLPDATVPKSVTYDDDRGKALSELFDLMDAWPMLNSSGVLTARPKAWPAPVGALTGVVSAPRSLESDRTYNRVVVEGKSPAGAAIYGIAEITQGFLRVKNRDGSRSPFGVATYRYSSDFLTSKAQCVAYARSLLPRVSQIRGVTREVTEPFNPIREVGDVLTFEGGLVRITKLSHSAALTQMTVEVPDE